MDPVTTSFYQTLSTVSFTLLSIWFAVMQFAHGGWRADPARHRSTMHIALHFLLPGSLGLSSLLSTASDGGIIWRAAFIIVGAIGVVEAVGFIQAPRGPTGAVERTLRVLDPVLYAALVVAAFIPARALVVTPLQVGGIVNGLLFLTGLCYVWLAFMEPDRTPPRGRGSPAP